MSNKSFLVIIVLLSLFLFAFVWPGPVDKGLSWIGSKFSKDDLSLPGYLNKPFVLGLDLLGGTHLMYQADLSQVPDGDRADALNGVRDVIERRVNFFGVSEPVVQISGNDRLIIELAGITDVNQAIALIGETPLLEFKEEKPDAQEIILAQQNGERLGEDPFMATGLNGSHLKRAQLIFDQTTGIAQVSLELNEEGAQLFANITKRNIGKNVAIYLDGYPISIPVVQSEILDGSAIISGDFNPQEAKLLATRLNSGALPVPINLISQQTVGASLGAQSLKASLNAGIWGLILVALFMLAFYRLPGFAAVIALCVYVLIVLSVYKLLPVTLTLAGIAGFILSMGIAVDANVLIFARMKEELSAGKSLSGAMHEGFSRAWLSIRDSHVTTLIGALVLYLFTTSIVKGFALTLGIGVLTSLFTAISVTRVFLYMFTSGWFEKHKWLFR